MIKRRIARRYILSIIIDYIILAIAIFPISMLISPDTAIFLVPVIFAIFFVYLIQDRLLGGASVGKRIVSLVVENVRPNEKLTFMQAFVRKAIEQLYIYKIFIWRLQIDIDKISGTRISFRTTNNIHDKQSRRKIVIFEDHYSSMIQCKRIKAFLYDSIFISWAWILYLLYQIPSFHQYVNDFSLDSHFWFKFLLYLIFFVYYVAKDFLFQKGSLGKTKVGLKIVDFDGKIPSGFQLMIRNVLWLGLSPIEIVLFAFKVRGISEYISYTKITQDMDEVRNAS